MRIEDIRRCLTSNVNRLMRFLVTNCVKSIFYHLPFVNDRKATHFYICSLIEVQPSWTDDENKDNSDKKQVSNLDKKHANCYFINFILKETSNLVTGGGDYLVGKWLCRRSIMCSEPLFSRDFELRKFLCF